MKTNVKNIVTSVIFLAVIVGMLLGCVLHKAKDYSESERRPLESFPTYESTYDSEKDMNFLLTLNKDIKDYINSFDKYTLDQFPARDLWRQIKSFVELNVFNKKDNGDMYVKDGYISEIDGKLDVDSVNKANKVFNNIYDRYLVGKADKVIISIIPDKHYFMGASGGYPSYDYDELVRLVCEGINENIEYVDIFDELELEDFYKTDTHWSQDKIVDVVKKLVTALGVADEYSFEYDVNEIDMDFFGIYSGKLGLKSEADVIRYLTSDIINKCKLYDYELQKYVPIYDFSKNNYEQSNGFDPYNFFLSGAKKGIMTIVNPSQNNGKELVVFRDSYGSSIGPLLVDGYSKVHFVDVRVTTAAVANMVLKGFDNKDVMFLYSSMIINNSNEMNIV